MHFYRFYINDYMVATRHLSNEEDLCYRRLLDLYYTEETPLPNDNILLSRKLQVEASVIESILSEYFELTECGWINVRALSEITAYAQLCAKRSGAGKSGGRPKAKQRKPNVKQKQTTTEANAPISVISNQQSNTPIVPTGDGVLDIKETSESNPDQGLSADFLSFWKAYPEKKEKRGAWKAWGRLKNRPATEVLVEAVRLQEVDRAQARRRNEFYPEWKNPATWLSAGCWEDQLKYAQKKEKSAGAIVPSNWREILIDRYPQNFPDGISGANFPSGFSLLPASVQAEVIEHAALVGEISEAIHANQNEEAA
jgi:uncharacterized protein YdaU (DUF1376 family)